MKEDAWARERDVNRAVLVSSLLLSIFFTYILMDLLDSHKAEIAGARQECKCELEQNKEKK